MRNCKTLAPGLLACVAVCGTASADDFFDERWTFNGFGTVGYAQTDKYDDRIPRRNIYQSGIKLRDNGWLMDSRLGFQVKYHLSDHWEFVGQAVARHQLDSSISSHIDMAFARWSNNDWQVSLGRQAFDLYFLSDHRNTGYSYDWVRPPSEFYSFMPYDSFEGVKVSRDWGDFDSAWRASLSVGRIEGKADIDVLSTGSDVDETEADPIYSTELTWQGGDWQFRASYAFLKFKQEIGTEAELRQLHEIFGPHWDDFGGVLRDIGFDSTLRYGSLGASWHKEDWKVQAEWSNMDTEFISFSGQRAYFSVSKRYGEWLPYGVFGWARDDNKFKHKKPPPGVYQAELNELYYSMLFTSHAFKQNQRSIGLGLRWDFTPQKALKLQCDKFWFDAWSGSIHGRTDAIYRNDETRSWCSVAMDWVF